MRHRIRVPDGTVVEIDAPDGATPEEITAFAEQSYKAQQPEVTQPSMAMDVSKSAAIAPAKALVGIAGLPGTGRELGQAGKEKLLSYLPESVGRLDASIPRMPSISNMLPSAGQLRQGVESITGPWYDPQTRDGKVADTGVQTALMMGRNWLTAPKQAAAVTGGVTAGTEGVGAATNDNPFMRVLGGLFGGGVPAAVNATRSRSGQVVRGAIGTPTQAEIDAALAMQARGQAEGVPLMGTESLDRGGQLASAIRASPTGNPIIEQFLNRRPAQVESAVARGLLAPTGPRDTPAANAARAQEAATGVIGNAEQARTAAVSPFYRAAESDSIPPWAMRPVANEIQSLLWKQPIGSKPAKTLGEIYNQAFPNTVEAPGTEAIARSGRVVPKSVDVQQDDVITAIRKLGGINPADEAVGSIAKGNPFPPDPRFGPVWRQPGYGTSVSNKTQAGHSLDEMAAKLHEHGYIPERDPDLVMEAIASTSLGRPQFSVFREVQQVDPLAQSIDRLVTQLATKAERKAVAPAPEAMAPETNVGVLGNLYKNLGIQRQLPDIGATAKDKLAAYPAGKVQDVLGDVLRQNSPNWRQGNALYERLTREQIDPLRAGPIGVIAGKTGFDPAAPSAVPRVIGAVADATVARTDTIREVYTRLNKVDKQAFPGMVQTHLENQLNAALDKNFTGPNPAAGAKFAKSIVGTPQEQANFDEMMRGVAVARGVNPNELVRGANNLMQVLERTGRTPGIGSQTQPRQEIAKELGKTKIGDIAMVASASPTKPAVARWNDRVLNARNEQIARALTADDSVQTLLKLAKVKPNGITASYYAAVLLGLDETTSGP
jgi:hypothetical protein